MRSGWLVRLTKSAAGSAEWYISMEANPEAAISAVRTLPGNAAHNIEVIRLLTAHEVRAIRIDLDQIRKNV